MHFLEFSGTLLLPRPHTDSHGFETQQQTGEGKKEITVLARIGHLDFIWVKPMQILCRNSEAEK
jgi:hypothetical protein